MRRWMPLTLSLTLAFAAGACRGKDEATPMPEATEAPPVSAIAPMLEAEQATVEYRERELAEGRELDPGEIVEIVPGANIITREGGRAAVTWDGFLSQHLLSGTDTLLSLSEPAIRYAILDQATGTARYALLGAGEAATVTVKAASWADVQLTEGEAEVIVSIVPGTEPASWIAVTEGQATVTRGTDTLTLTKGQVAAVTAEGDLPTPAEVDAELLGDWYDDVEAGNTVGDMASTAYRCSVSAAEAVVYAEPAEDADPVGDPLPQGTVVAVIQRDEPGTFVRVTDERFFQALKDTASGELPEDLLDGWVASGALSCNGPTSGISMDPPEELGTKPTATPQPLPTRPPALIPTRLPTLAVTFTPTPTPTGAAATIQFWAEDDEIALGECTELRWKLRNIKAWYLDGGAGVGDDGSKEVCPKKTTTYSIRVILPNDTEVKKSVTIKVRAAEASATPKASATPRPAPATATSMVAPTAVPPTAVPPTAVPPTAVPPTAVPPTAVPPTAEPPTSEPPTAEPPTSEPPTAPAP